MHNEVKAWEEDIIIPTYPVGATKMSYKAAFDRAAKFAEQLFQLQW